MPPDRDRGDAARAMREHDIGFLVVTDDSDELVGVITDRDIVVRVVATDQPASTTVGDVMSHEPASLGADHSVDDATQQMALRTCRRLPVVDSDGRVVGVVTMDDVLLHAGDTLDEIARVVGVERRHRSFG